MTHTTQETDRRASNSVLPAPPWWAKWWVWAVAAVVATVAAITVVVWPDDEPSVPATTQAPATTQPPGTTQAPGTTGPTTLPPVAQQGALLWRAATSQPSGSVRALAATETGFVAAVQTAQGVEFWSSDDGDAWIRLGSGADAFGTDLQVAMLQRGGAGYVATVIDPADLYAGPSATVWVSPDGATWRRTELVGQLPEPPSRYIVQEAMVARVLIGPSSFLAVGSGGLSPDLDAIAAAFAPGFTAADVYAVDAELRPEGAVLIVGFGDEEPLEIPFADLGVDAEDLAGIFESDDVEGPGMEVFTWVSTDGTEWESIEMVGLDHPSTPMWAASVGGPDALYLFAAGPDPEDPEGPGVVSGYRSVDGRSWDRFALRGPGEDWMRNVAYGAGTFIAIGEDEAGDGMWTSPDAVTWTRVPHESLFGLVPEGSSLTVTEVVASDAGIAFSALAYSEPPEGYAPEPVISKDGYLVTLGEEEIVLADEATGRVIAEIGHETMMSDTVEVEEREGGVTFIDRASRDELVTVTWEEIEAEFRALDEESGIGERMVPMIGFSPDGVTWTLEREADVFGEGRFTISGAIGRDAVLALVTSDREAWESGAAFADPPPTEIWIGVPAD